MLYPLSYGGCYIPLNAFSAVHLISSRPRTDMADRARVRTHPDCRPRSVNSSSGVGTMVADGVC